MRKAYGFPSSGIFFEATPLRRRLADRIIFDPSNEGSDTYDVALAKGRRDLNTLGFQGWELVGPGTIGGKKVLYLKRAK